MTTAARATARTAKTETDRMLRLQAAAQLRSQIARIDISSRELARRIGVSHTWVTDRRKGDTAISLEDIHKLAPHLGLTPGALFGLLSGEERAQGGGGSSGPTGASTGGYATPSSGVRAALSLVPAVVYDYTDGIDGGPPPVGPHLRPVA